MAGIPSAAFVFDEDLAIVRLLLGGLVFPPKEVARVPPFFQFHFGGKARCYSNATKESETNLHSGHGCMHGVRSWNIRNNQSMSEQVLHSWCLHDNLDPWPG